MQTGRFSQHQDQCFMTQQKLTFSCEIYESSEITCLTTDPHQKYGTIHPQLLTICYMPWMNMPRSLADVTRSIVDIAGGRDLGGN